MASIHEENATTTQVDESVSPTTSVDDVIPPKPKEPVQETENVEENTSPAPRPWPRLKTPEREAPPEYELVVFNQPVNLKPVPHLPRIHGHGRRTPIKFNERRVSRARRLFDSDYNLDSG